METELQESKDEDEDETSGDQSMLKDHISLPPEKIVAAAGRKKFCYFFIPDLTLNKSMINILRTPMDVFGGPVCRISDRAKIKTTRIDTNVKSNLQLFATFLIVVCIVIRMEVKIRESVNLDNLQIRMSIFCSLWSQVR